MEHTGHIVQESERVCMDQVDRAYASLYAGNLVVYVSCHAILKGKLGKNYNDVNK